MQHNAAHKHIATMLYLRNVNPGDAITVYTRDEEGEEVREPYNATYVRTKGDAYVVISRGNEEHTIRLYDTLNFNVEEGQLFVVEELEGTMREGTVSI